MEGVVSVFPNRIRKLLTTRSYDYLGLPLNIKRNLEVESDVIIGLLDTGTTSKWTNPINISLNPRQK